MNKLPPLTPEGERAVQKMAADAAKMILRTSTNLATRIANHLKPDMDVLTKKMARRLKQGDTERQRLEVAKDFITDVEKLLESVNVDVTVNGKSFKVKGS